jgi:hypothetical protein
VGRQGNPRLGHKYHACRTIVDGIHFASKREAKYYQELLVAQKAGDVLTFLHQIPFRLPGGIRYSCDFLVFYADGGVDFVDVKGYETPAFKRNKKMVEELYAPITITVVR